MHDTIDHIGFISAIRNGKAYVSLVQVSACAKCSSKSVCGVGNSEKRHFEIPVDAKKWQVGDEVMVMVGVSTGFKALWLGYVLPFFLLLITLIVSTKLGVPEARAGLLACCVLIPYYVGLSMFRSTLRKSIHVKIQKR
jgi:sigma-E factor negative regulatory protein RseC